MKYKVGDKTVLGTIRNEKTIRPTDFPENDFQEYDLYCVHTRHDKVWFTESEIDKIIVKPTGDISDGYHTFEELYHQRAILFSTICQLFPDKAWKSKKHADGTMFDDHFIVGIDTPSGQYTYHYGMSKWNQFPIKEVSNAPKWDGHTGDDVRRLFSLIKPKRNIDHLMELWDSGKRTDATTYFIQKMGVSGHLYLCLEHLMQEIPTKYRYPKLTPEELRAVKWLVEGGFTKISKNPLDVAAFCENAFIWIPNTQITGCLMRSEWIAREPINLAELLAAQEDTP